MGMHRSIKGAFTDFGTVQLYPLGERRSELVHITTVAGVEFDAWVEYMYVMNDEAANPFVIGQPVYRDATPGVNGCTGLNSGATYKRARGLGIPISAIPHDQFGWVVRKGPVYVITDGNVASGDYLMTAAAAATMDTDAAAAETIWGIALETDDATPACYMLLELP